MVAAAVEMVAGQERLVEVEPAAVAGEGRRPAGAEKTFRAYDANRVLLLAPAVDADEDERYGPDRGGDELPQALRRRELRLARIREAKQALEAEAAEREQARRAELGAEAKKPRQPPNGRDRLSRSLVCSATSPIRSRRS